MLKKVGAILGAAVFLAGMIASYHAFDCYVAKAEDIKQLRSSVQKLNSRMDRREDMDRARELQHRIWDLERHYQKNPPMPQSVRREIQMLQAERENLLTKWAK